MEKKYDTNEILDAVQDILQEELKHHSDLPETRSKDLPVDTMKIINEAEQYIKDN
tara:strand:- start:607 stop:771 length:165 start_codon:yes stop_codon:yes gene_type:complete